MSSNYPFAGPPLDFYLRSQKVSLNFQDTTAHQFYSRFSFHNIRETLQEGKGSDPTYMARVAQCVFEQMWFESQVATVVQHLVQRLGVNGATYSWWMVHHGTTQWNPEFVLKGTRNTREPEDDEDHPVQEPFELKRMIPEPVISDVQRSMRVWLDKTVSEFWLSRAQVNLSSQQAELDKATEAWEAHQKAHPH